MGWKKTIYPLAVDTLQCRGRFGKTARIYHILLGGLVSGVFGPRIRIWLQLKPGISFSYKRLEQF